MNEAPSLDRPGNGHIRVTASSFSPPPEVGRWPASALFTAPLPEGSCPSSTAHDASARYAGTSPAKLEEEGRRQCLRLGISGSGTMRMPAASSPSRTALETVTAVGPSPCTQIESTWQGMRLPEVE